MSPIVRCTPSDLRRSVLASAQSLSAEARSNRLGLMAFSALQKAYVQVYGHPRRRGGGCCSGYGCVGSIGRVLKSKKVIQPVRKLKGIKGKVTNIGLGLEPCPGPYLLGEQHGTQ